MAIPTNIKTLLSGEVVEWARIEFKETWDPAASLKTVCAFANDLDNWGGGYIVIGVEEEDGRPVYPLKGVPAEKLDKYQKEIFAKCKLIRPAYMPIIGVETYQNKHFIVIWCPGGETRPYSSPKTMDKDNKERIHYIRKSSNSVEPTDDEEKDLFNLANRVPFDDRVNHKAEISDLNITLIQNYLKEVKSSLYEKSKTGDFVEVCQDMNIVSTLPEYIKPKNVGLMFFSMEPVKFFPYTQIDVVQFPSGLGGNDIIEKTFNGPIHQQLRDALQYIKNVIITEKVVKHPDRAEADRFFNFPYAAVEEALSNAVYHTRTPGLLIRSQSLYPAELPTHTFRSEQDVFYHAGRGLSTVFCRFFDFIFVFYFSAQKSTSFQYFPRGPQASSARRSAMRTPVGVAARPPWPVSRRSGESRLPTRPMASMTSSQGMA